MLHVVLSSLLCIVEICGSVFDMRKADYFTQCDRKGTYQGVFDYVATLADSKPCMVRGSTPSQHSSDQCCRL